VIIGAVGMLGLNMLMAGIGRGFRRSISQRQGRRSGRRETKAVVQDRDHLAAELEREHAARVHADEQRVADVDRQSPAGTTVDPRVVHLEAQPGEVSDGAPARSSAVEPGAVPSRER
jgi:hypothetical protein